jgi:adenylate cyclase
MAEPAGAAIERRVAVPLTVGLVAANVLGAAVVFAFVAWILPLPPVDDDGAIKALNAIALGAGLAVAVPAGFAWSGRRLLPSARWVLEDRDPRPDEQLVTLRAPLRLLQIQAALWAFGAVLFALLNLHYSVRLGLAVGITAALGGAVTCALSYLLAERIMRPVTERALAGGVPDEPAVPGVRARVLLAWALSTGAPVLGLVLVGGAQAVGISDASGDRLATTMVFLGATALAVGLLGMALVAHSVADPLEGLRHAVRAVGAGRTDVEVRVTDGSEVGLLQAGFNRMVAGLREREEMRDLFGRQVGEDVARQALERGVELGGEELDVGVLFVDLVGSTRLAADRPPHEVVAVLNEFFGLVVSTVTELGGSVNKFEGDAALCVFGAPLPRDDPAGDALAAARALCRALRDGLPRADFGIGVSAGETVAGNIGAAERFEYTVIGDPVNEAARLTELAKEDEGRVLASGAALERARAPERSRWRVGECVTLRGRPGKTRLARPGSS